MVIYVCEFRRWEEDSSDGGDVWMEKDKDVGPTSIVYSMSCLHSIRGCTHLRFFPPLFQPFLGYDIVHE